jgi:hypothetical protein
MQIVAAAARAELVAETEFYETPVTDKIAEAGFGSGSLRSR